MVICPIALAVHCTGCPFFKFCPAKTILGDYKPDNLDKTSKAEKTDKDNFQDPGEKPGNSNN